MAAVSLKEVIALFITLMMKKAPNNFEDTVKTVDGTCLLEEYDFIIVGGGTAGSVVAKRISEIAEWKVLLLEAGGQENGYTRTPVLWQSLQGTQYVWKYETTKQSRACLARGGVCPQPAGRLLGGSSSVNGMIYARGYPSDYNRWGRDVSGWSFKDVEPYFLQIENYNISKYPGHGRNGPVHVTNAELKPPIADKLIQAGKELGLKHGDCPSHEENCIYHTHLTIKDGKRFSASRSYLEPTSRDNLHVVTGAEVTRLVIEENQTKGVQFTYKQKTYEVKARKEVVLSAGTMGSAKILMLSGIGPKTHLSSLGIPVVADLPVGNNLQDHTRVPLYFKVPANTTIGLWNLDNKTAQEDYIELYKGPFTWPKTAATAWVRCLTNGPPNVQFHMGTELQNVSLVGANTFVVRPKSRGTIRLSSKDPTKKLLIDANYFYSQHDFDAVKCGLRFALRIFQTKTLNSIGAVLYKELHPACAKYTNLQEYLTCVIEYYSETVYHYVGTAKMGSKDNGGVVDGNLRVYGVDQLRVIDASIAPTVVSMNTNAMSYMIGEKGSDLIKAGHGKQTSQPVGTNETPSYFNEVSMLRSEHSE